MAAQPIPEFAAYQPLGRFQTPEPIQPIRRRQSVQPYPGMNRNHPPPVTRQQRLNSIGHVMQRNNLTNQFVYQANRSRFQNSVIENKLQPLGGIMPYAPNAFSPSPRRDMYAQSRQEFEYFRHQQALKKQQEKDAYDKYFSDLATYHQIMKEEKAKEQEEEKWDAYLNTLKQLSQLNGARINVPLIAPNALYSPFIHDKYPTLAFGEQAMGENTNKPPRLIKFNNDQSLADQLWANYQHGEGQPIRLNMEDLDFNDNINMIMHLHNTHALGLLRRKHIDPKALSKALGKKLKVHGNEQVTHMFLEENITDFGLNFEFGSPEWAAFGHLIVDIGDVHILVHHDQGNLIEVNANIKPTGENGELDGFDFNPLPWGKRSIPGEIATREIHYGLPSGTSFKILGKGASKFQQKF